MTTVEILKEMAFTATETQRRALEEAISALENKGEWIKDEKMIIVFDIYRCSRCSADGEPRYKFCPNCGADMRGE